MNPVVEKLFSGKTGNILLLALFLTFSLLFFLVIAYMIDTTFANKIMGMVASNIVIGRLPSLSLGYASDLSHFWVISTNVLTEFLMVLYIYPLFVLSFNGMVRLKPLENFFNQVKEKKEEHKVTFEKYGRFGLFIFVFIPFWMTGPIVGALIGFLIGLKHYTIIFIVLIATIISISLWGLFLQEIIGLIKMFDTNFLWYGLGFVIVMIVLIRYRGFIQKRFKQLLKEKEE